MRAQLLALVALAFGEAHAALPHIVHIMVDDLCVGVCQ